MCMETSVPCRGYSRGGDETSDGYGEGRRTRAMWARSLRPGGPADAAKEEERDGDGPGEKQGARRGAGKRGRGVAFVAGPQIGIRRSVRVADERRDGVGGRNAQRVAPGGGEVGELPARRPHDRRGEGEQEACTEDRARRHPKELSPGARERSSV